MSKEEPKQAAEVIVQSKRSRKWWLVGASILLAAVFGAVVAFGAYLQYITPQQAPHSYFERLADANSAEYELELVVGESEGEFNLTGSGEFADLTTDETQLSFYGGLTATELPFSLALDFRLIADNLYLRSSEIDIFKVFLPTLEADTWYSWQFEPEDTSELSGRSCSVADTTAIKRYAAEDLSDRVELEDARRHNWLPIERNGHQIIHYSGIVPGRVFAAIAADLRDVTSDDCITLGDSDELDAAQMQLGYDIYTGQDYDEAVVKILDKGKQVASFSLTTRGYAYDVELEIPENSKSLESLWEDLSASYNFTGQLESSSSDGFLGL
ncbi:MAG: hypothetical protein WD467_03085 [Candidatus Saccharimonadales bacterium]